MKKNQFNWRFISLLFFIVWPFYNVCIAQQSAIGDSRVKIYYDDKLQVLSNNDSQNASYYRVINYRNGSIYGAVTDYYKSGKPLMKGYFSDNNPSKGHENGTFTWYYESGTVFQTCNYVNGAIDGAYVEYYPSGLKKSCVSYVMGNRNGCEYSWDEGGNASVYNKDYQNCPCAILANENLNRSNKDTENQKTNPITTGDFCFNNVDRVGYKATVALYRVGKNDVLKTISVNEGETKCMYELPPGIYTVNISWSDRWSNSIPSSTQEIRVQSGVAGTVQLQH